MNRVVYDSALGGSCPRCGKRIDRCNCGGQQDRARTPTSGPAGRLPRDGTVRVLRDRGGRGGKVVTVVAGLPIEDAPAVGTELKRLCGSGGTTKGDVVEIQGDHRDRVAEVLRARGYTVKLAGG